MYFINSIDDTRNIPIIFLSAPGDLESIPGYYDYIVKPFKEYELVAKVRALATVKKDTRSMGILRPGALLLHCLRTFDLEGHLEIQVEGRVYDICIDEFRMPLPLEILHSTAGKGKIFIQNRSMTVNFDKVSLLIFNMPVDKANQCGRLTGLVFQLPGTISEKIKLLETSKLLHNLNQKMGRLLRK